MLLLTLALTAATENNLLDAVKRGDVGAVKTLLRAKSDANSADPDGITASGHNGVLTISIPKRPESTPRRIQVGAVLNS